MTRLRKWYGRAKWRKVKGVAQVLLPNGRIRVAEIIGRKRTGLVKENSN